MDLETPREAMLRAENERLKAEVEYLRRAVDPSRNLKFTPIAALDEITVSSLTTVIKLPVVASVQGNLSRHGDYHVIARLKHSHPEDLLVQYHAPADAIKGRADYAVNELFPYLHHRFIAALVSAINKPRDEVA
jgi:hypothetical protein